MFIGFSEPTFTEARFGRVLQTAAFVESDLVLTALSIAPVYRSWRMPVSMLLVSVFAVSWMLVATYSPVVLKLGSAIRCRTGYELLVLLIIFSLISRDASVHLRPSSAEHS